MEPVESYIYSFVIKIWLEEPVTENGEARWRGHITNVPSGEKRYFEDLQIILEFINNYLGRTENPPDKDQLDP